MNASSKPKSTVNALILISIAVLTLTGCATRNPESRNQITFGSDHPENK